MTELEFQKKRLSLPIINTIDFIFTEEYRSNGQWNYYMADGGYTQVLTDTWGRIRYVYDWKNNSIKEEKY